jgi:hypothetical protein
MATEKHDAHETTRIVPDIVFLHDVARTRSEEAARTRTNFTVIVTTTAIVITASSGHQTMMLEGVSMKVMIMVTGAKTTMVDGDRILENLNVALGIVHRS